MVDQSPLYGYIRVRDANLLIKYENFNDYQNLKRGIHIIELDVETCTVTQFKYYNTGLVVDESHALASYVNGLSPSTVLVGVTADEPIELMQSDAHTALSSIGVDISYLEFRGKMVFIAQVGRPSSTLVKSVGPGGNYLSVNAIVSGESPAVFSIVLNNCLVFRLACVNNCTLL